MQSSVFLRNFTAPSDKTVNCCLALLVTILCHYFPSSKQVSVTLVEKIVPNYRPSNISAKQFDQPKKEKQSKQQIQVNSIKGLYYSYHQLLFISIIYSVLLCLFSLNLLFTIIQYKMANALKYYNNFQLLFVYHYTLFCISFTVFPFSLNY